jgi:hypothetical protein
MSDAPKNHPKPRSGPLTRFMAAPVILAVILMVATVTLGALSWFGSSASGPRVRIHFTGTCAAEAAPIITMRGAAIGLGEPELKVQGDGLVLQVTLPGLEDDLTHIPRVLSQPGRIEVVQGETAIVTREQVTNASIRLDEGGAPYAWLDLKPEAIKALEAALLAAPNGTLDVRMDGEVLATRPNSRGIKNEGLRIITPGEIKPTRRMQIAADTSIVIESGVIPCDLRIAEVTPVTAP